MIIMSPEYEQLPLNRIRSLKLSGMALDMVSLSALESILGNNDTGLAFR